MALQKTFGYISIMFEFSECSFYRRTNSDGSIFLIPQVRHLGQFSTRVSNAFRDIYFNIALNSLRVPVLITMIYYKTHFSFTFYLMRQNSECIDLVQRESRFLCI